MKSRNTDITLIPEPLNESMTPMVNVMPTEDEIDYLNEDQIELDPKIMVML